MSDEEAPEVSGIQIDRRTVRALLSDLMLVGGMGLVSYAAYRALGWEAAAAVIGLTIAIYGYGLGME